MSGSVPESRLPPKRILILIYEGFAEFEMSLLGFIAVEEKNSIVTAAPDDTMQVTGAGGLKVCADLGISRVRAEKYDALIIPGGLPEPIIDRDEVSGLIREFHESGRLVAAICIAPVHLARAGILAGRAYTTSLSENYRNLFDWSRKSDRPVVVDGNIITARGNAFTDFALTVLEKLEAYEESSHAELWRKEFNRL